MLKSKRNLGASFIKAKKYGQAEATFAAIAADAKDPVAQAIAEIGRAEVNLARGQVDLARVQLTNVLAVRFAAEEERPRAMWLLAQAYGELHKKGEKGARAHGRRYLKDLVKHYPGSDLAAQARKLLK